MPNKSDTSHRHQFQALREARPTTAAATLPLVIWRDHIHSGNERDINYHADFFSLYFVRQGRGTHVIDGISYGVARGDVYAMGLGMTHWFTDCDNLVTDTLHFAPSVFDSETLDTLAETPGFQSLFVEEPLRRAAAQGEGGRWLHLSPDSYAPVATMLAELSEEWGRGTPEGTLLARGLFLRLLVHLARRHAERGTLGSITPYAAHESTVAAAVRYLDEHFADSLRIEQVAASVFLSPDRFTEVFARAMGRTPRDYVRHLRLERAKTLPFDHQFLHLRSRPVRRLWGSAVLLPRLPRCHRNDTPRIPVEEALGRWPRGKRTPRIQVGQHRIEEGTIKSGRAGTGACPYGKANILVGASPRGRPISHSIKVTRVRARMCRRRGGSIASGCSRNALSDTGNDAQKGGFQGGPVGFQTGTDDFGGFAASHKRSAVTMHFAAQAKYISIGSPFGQKRIPHLSLKTSY